MRNILSTSLLSAVFFLTAAHADQRVIFSCTGVRAVGYQTGSLSPRIFDDRPTLRVLERNGWWVLQILQREWTYVTSEKPNGDMWFVPSTDIAGVYFAMNTENLRFSYLDTLDYMAPESRGGAPHLTVGTCRRGEG